MADPTTRSSGRVFCPRVLDSDFAELIQSSFEVFFRLGPIEVDHGFDF